VQRILFDIFQTGNVKNLAGLQSETLKFLKVGGFLLDLVLNAEKLLDTSFLRLIRNSGIHFYE